VEHRWVAARVGSSSRAQTPTRNVLEDFSLLALAVQATRVQRELAGGSKRVGSTKKMAFHQVEALFQQRL
jgi:hypothetical protein